MSDSPIPPTLLPPPGAEGQIGPRPRNYSGDIRPFCRYDARGAIIEGGLQASGFTGDAISAGELIAFGDPNFVSPVSSVAQNYVTDLDTNPTVVPRPPLGLAFDTLDLLVMQEAVMPGLPPATVTFTGPSHGAQEHAEAGTLQIGWTTPGIYTVTIEAFPAMPAVFEFTVRGRVMIHGPSLVEAQEKAKAKIMLWFVSVAEMDGTPATLRALYVMKAEQAKGVLNGIPSDLISREAELRNCTPSQMAGVIVAMAKQSEDMEIRRMQINVAIEAATSQGQVVEILKQAGLEFGDSNPLVPAS